MTKLAVILFAALAATANAFAPPSQAARSSSVLNAVEMESLRGGTGPETGGKMVSNSFFETRFLLLFDSREL